MKEKQHKLIDLIFDLDEKADNQASKGAKPKKIVWKRRFYRTNPLARYIQLITFFCENNSSRQYFNKIMTENV